MTHADEHGFPAWLAAQASRRPHAPALIAGKRTVSYAALAEAASRRAGMLAAAGIGPGDAVGWTARATIPSLAWLHALLWAGATIVPLRPGPADGSEIAPTMDALGVRAMIIECPGAGRTLARDREPAVFGLNALPPDAAAPVDPVPFDARRRAIVLGTSGSQGSPKRVPLTMGQIAASASAVARRIGLDPNDRWLLCLPLTHIGGLAIVLRSVLTGAAVIVHRRFDAGEVLGALAARARPAPTLASVVPTMLVWLLETASGPIPNRLRAMLVGGAPAAPALLERARARGLPVVPTWGMTEAGSQLATLAPAEAAGIDFAAHPGVVGKPLDGVELRIEHEPPGSRGPGRIHVRGPMLFDGYLDVSTGAARGKSPRTTEGWFDSGDLGYLDGHGRLHVVGRGDAMIVTGGVNVAPENVERALRASGLVEDAVVLGLPDRRWGQQVGAVLVAADPASGLIEALEQWCRQHLDPAERPRRWRIVARLPRTDSGKPARQRLAQLFESGTNRARSGLLQQHW